MKRVYILTNLLLVFLLSNKLSAQSDSIGKVKEPLQIVSSTSGFMIERRSFLESYWHFDLRLRSSLFYQMYLYTLIPEPVDPYARNYSGGGIHCFSMQAFVEVSLPKPLLFIDQWQLDRGKTFNSYTTQSLTSEFISPVRHNETAVYIDGVRIIEP